jgi:phosphatidylethanolamine/phosphatidyl-N-methylethanolamine N-methyltransferase
MRYWAECGDFFRECRRHFRNTGSILPSSPFLARALAAQLRPRRPAGRILEVGPGTGSVTKEILRCLLPADRLDAVEINAHFVALIRERLEGEWCFRYRTRQVQVIHSAVEDLPGEGVYDYIVSGLPINNFPVSQVRDIFRAYVRLLKPGGTLSYYEYALIRQLKTPFVNRRERRRLYKIGRVIGSYVRDFQIHRERIFINVPPAMVRHLRFQPNLVPVVARR